MPSAIAWVTAIALATSSLLVGASPASAAETPTITWSAQPADETGPDGRNQVDVTLDPRESSLQYMAVRNLGDADTTFRLSAADGYFTATGRFNMLPAQTASTAAGIWISITDEVAVPAGKTAIVPFTITVPDNATPGDHAAGVAASVLTTGTNEAGASVGVDSRIGFMVGIRVNGD